eukprot:TRINITY_DN981_c0_g1_i1.p1 TRINITY_DN981_c0_g1~~TRINITY_DN981_c0_g1_i1.p1  ORF type:complete len:176 (+),score=32.57 TRINITY_DN981_c0_g1_i1:116-643(+)
MMHQSLKIPTKTDIMSEQAMYNILDPKYHGLVREWMRTASDTEKKGIIKLGKLAEPQLTKTIGRPKPNMPEPGIQNAPWYAKQLHPVFAPRQPDPYMPVPDDQYQVPAWMHEDSYEAEQIPKPGGCIIKLKDTQTIMRLKNTQRNQGTYKLFSGQFDGTTTTGATHNQEALGYQM